MPKTHTSTKSKRTKWDALDRGAHLRREFSPFHTASIAGFQLVGEVFVSNDHVRWYLQPTSKRGRIASKATIDTSSEALSGARPVVNHPPEVIEQAKRECEQAARDLAHEILTALGEAPQAGLGDLFFKQKKRKGI